MIKICSVCGDPISERSRVGMCKRCYDKAYHKKRYADNPCIREALKAGSKKYYEANKAMVATKGKKYYEANKEAIQAYHKKQYDEDPHKQIVANKEYREANKEAIQAYHKKRYADNPERHKRLVKRWKERNPDKCREMRGRKRTHVLSFSDPDCKILNKWFEGSEGHHLTWDEGVYIPKELHRSIRHNCHTGRGMAAINIKAIEWYCGGEIPGSKRVQTSLYDICTASDAEAII